jgi:small subunit ribosomal protein S13
MAQAEQQDIVRIAGNDIKGSYRVLFGLENIKGVGFSMSNAVLRALNIPYNKRIRELTESEVEKIEDAIKNPAKYGIPNWLYNRRFDRESGEDKHLIEGELIIAQKFDIRRLEKINAYRGVRHKAGLPVRGQRTRTSFRKGARVGVVRTKIKEAKKEEKKQDTSKEKKEKK